jgi:hypothetical protein
MTNVQQEMNKIKEEKEYKSALTICEVFIDNKLLYHNDKIKKYIINQYNLEIPIWLYDLISICCGKYEHFATIMFNDIINSIKSRKFN